MPAWQKRHPRVQPRRISTFRRSCTSSANGTTVGSQAGEVAKSFQMRFTIFAGNPRISGAPMRLFAVPRPHQAHRRATAHSSPPNARRRAKTQRATRPLASFPDAKRAVREATLHLRPTKTRRKTLKKGSALNAQGPPATISGFDSSRSAARSGCVPNRAFQARWWRRARETTRNPPRQTHAAAHGFLSENAGTPSRRMRSIMSAAGR